MLEILLGNSAAYHSGLITYAEFGAVQRLAWDAIERQPAAVKKTAILDALRKRLPGA